MVLLSRPPLRKGDEDLLNSFLAPTIFAAIDYVSDVSGFALVDDQYIVGQASGKLLSVDLWDPRKRDEK